MKFYHTFVLEKFQFQPVRFKEKAVKSITMDNGNFNSSQFDLKKMFPTGKPKF